MARQQKVVKTPRILTEEKSVNVFGILVVTSVLAAGSWLVFDYGRSQGGIGYNQMVASQESLENKIEQQNIADKELRLTIADLERKAEIEREAAQQVQEANRQLQDEHAVLNKKIAFLTGLLGEKALQLDVKTLSLKRDKKPGEFTYDFRVERSGESKGKIKGALDISLKGLLNDQATKLSLKELTKPALAAHKLRFSNFQDISGKLLIPAGFTPESLVIDVKLKDSQIAPYTKTFDWLPLHEQEKKS